MAGGHGGIDFLNSSFNIIVDKSAATILRKPTNRVELDFYLSIFEGNNKVWKLRSDYLYLKDFIPNFYGHEDSSGVLYIYISNIAAGIRAAKLMDVKVGTWTVSQKELKATGMSTMNAFIKKRKLQVVDWWTMSTDRSYRIVDIGDDSDRSELARKNSQKVFIEFFNRKKQVLRKAAYAVNKLESTVKMMVQRNPIVFISSSILFCYNINIDDVKICLIDFAHTHLDSPSNLNLGKYQNSFMHGLNGLYSDLQVASNRLR